MQRYEVQIEALTLIPSDGGRFEVEVNGDLVYSKLRTGRHIETGEAAALIREYLDRR
jgi:selenoprotein W-related protein